MQMRVEEFNRLVDQCQQADEKQQTKNLQKSMVFSVPDSPNPKPKKPLH
jgi:hypothetical protein